MEFSTYKEPEHRMRVMLKIHPKIPVPMTAMKIAAGALSRSSGVGQRHIPEDNVPAYAARLTSSLQRIQSEEDRII